ncbi:MAG: amidohydrolase [Bacteroidetes bacterium]|nr:amidohydrolase [Bacteroidota bacterium]
MELKEQIQNLAQAYFEEIRAIRRHLHQNPELSFQEFNTSNYIASILEKEGIEYERNWVKTGIVATIMGQKPSGKITAIRADIDALPIQETNEVPYKSCNDGVMHACGHDVHTASALGAALILNDLRDEWAGTIKFVFQPAEEKLPGGASLMIKEGLFERHKMQSIFGQHVQHDLPEGKVGFRPGKYMASCDEIYLTVKGKGGHGALPHNLVDPVMITAQILVALQQVVSRQAKPLTPTVLSFGRIEANGATNIIPDKVELQGTFRTYDEEWRDQAHLKITEIATGIAQSFGGNCEVDIRKGYPFVFNDEDLTEKAISWAKDYMGAENVVDLEMRPTGEDFSFYGHHIPATFYRLGVANFEKNITSSIHTSTFDIDEKALVTGAGLMAFLALKKLDS